MSKGVGMAVGPMTSFGGLKTIAATLVDGGILRLGLNRPKVNAINLQLLEDMRDAFALAAASKDVKGVLVASNNPKCFSAGLDLAELYGHITAGNRDALEHFAFTTMTPAFLGPSKCPKPVAAAVDGHAIAGGLILGLACDYFVVNPANTAARFGLTELLVGVPFPQTPLDIVRHHAPVAAAKRLVFTAELVDAATAVDWGIATSAATGQTVEESALAWLRTATSRPLDGFAATKKLWWADLHARSSSKEDVKVWLDTIMSPPCAAAIHATFNKK